MARRMAEQIMGSGLQVLVIWLLIFQGPMYAEEDVDRTVKALEAAFDTWVSKLEFACSFEQSSTTADSFEDAIQEKYQSPPQWQFRGEYAMVAGKLIRHAVTAVRQPRQKVDGHYVGYELHQYARNVETGVLLRWTPGSLTFLPARLDTGASAGDLVDVATAFDVLFPVLLHGSPGRHNNPVRLVRHPEVSQKTTLNVDRPSRDVIELRAVYGDPSHTEQRLVFAVKDGIPLIIRDEYIGLLEDGTRELRSVTLLEDFVAVRGGQMPSKRRTMIRLYYGGVGVTIWKSEDLGRRRPQPSDFLVVVPASQSVMSCCIRKSSIPSAVSGQRRFDISKMSADDFDPSCIAGAPKLAVSPGASRRGSWVSRWWLWIGVGIVVVGLVGYVTYRLRHR